MLILIILLISISNSIYASPGHNPFLHDNHFKWIEEMNMQMMKRNLQTQKRTTTSSHKKVTTKKKKDIDIKIEVGFIKVNNFAQQNNCLSLSDIDKSYVQSSVDQHGWDLESYPNLNSKQLLCRNQILQDVDRDSSTLNEEEKKELLTKSIIDQWLMRSLKKSLLPNADMSKSKLHAGIYNQGFEVIGYLPVISSTHKDEDETTKTSSGMLLIIAKFNESNLGLIGETGSISVTSKDAKISIKGFLGALTHSNMVIDNDSIKFKASTFFQENKKISLGSSTNISLARILGYLTASMQGKMTESIDFAAKGDLGIGILRGSNLLTNGEAGFQSRGDKHALTFVKIRVLRGLIAQAPEKNPKEGQKFLSVSNIHLGQIRKYKTDDGNAGFEIGLTFIQPTSFKKRAALGQFKLEILPSSAFSLNITGKGAVSQSVKSSSHSFWAKAKADSKIKIAETGFSISAYYFIQTGMTPIDYGEGNFLDMDLLPIEIDGAFYQYGLMLEYVFE